MIRIFFADGTHEDRDGGCPLFGRRPTKHPRTGWWWGARFALGCQGYVRLAVSLPAERCLAGGTTWWAYRLASGFGEGERLRGRWEPVTIETYEAKCRRLMPEHEEAVRRLRTIKRAVEALRAAKGSDAHAAATVALLRAAERETRDVKEEESGH